MKLTPGRYYTARNGAVWLCISAKAERPEQAYAYCVREQDNHIEYFYEDGRYDYEGKREHTLIAELPRGFKELHETLDLIVAMFLASNPDALPSGVSILDLIQWTNEQATKEEADAATHPGR